MLRAAARARAARGPARGLGLHLCPGEISSSSPTAASTTRPAGAPRRRCGGRARSPRPSSWPSRRTDSAPSPRGRRRSWRSRTRSPQSDSPGGLGHLAAARRRDGNHPGPKFTPQSQRRHHHNPVRDRLAAAQTSRPRCAPPCEQRVAARGDRRGRGPATRGRARPRCSCGCARHRSTPPTGTPRPAADVRPSGAGPARRTARPRAPTSRRSCGRDRGRGDVVRGGRRGVRRGGRWSLRRVRRGAVDWPVARPQGLSYEEAATLGIAARPHCRGRATGAGWQEGQRRGQRRLRRRGHLRRADRQGARRLRSVTAVATPATSRPWRASARDEVVDHTGERQPHQAKRYDLVFEEAAVRPWRSWSQLLDRRAGPTRRRPRRRRGLGRAAAGE